MRVSGNESVAKVTKPNPDFAKDALRRTRPSQARTDQGAGRLAHAALRLGGGKVLRPEIPAARPLRVQVSPGAKQAALEVEKYLTMHNDKSERRRLGLSKDEMRDYGNQLAFSYMNAYPNKAELVMALDEARGLAGFEKMIFGEARKAAFAEFVANAAGAIREYASLERVSVYVGRSAGEKNYVGMIRRIKRAQGEAVASSLVRHAMIINELQEFIPSAFPAYYTLGVCNGDGSPEQKIIQLKAMLINIKPTREMAREQFNKLASMFGKDSPTRVLLEQKFTVEWQSGPVTKLINDAIECLRAEIDG